MFTNSIRARITLLLSTVAVAALGGFLIYHAVAARQEARVYQRTAADKQRLIRRILNLNGRSIDNLAFDYSFSDALSQFAQRGGRSWAKANLDTSLSTFKATGCWVYNKNGQLVYGVDDGRDSRLTKDPVQPAILGKLFEKSPFCHFYTDSPAGVLEIRGAEIHKSRDYQRTGPKFGYFFVGRIWSEDYLKELGVLTESSISLVPANARSSLPASVRNHSHTIFIDQPLAGWDAKPVAVLRLVSNSPVLLMQKQYRQRIVTALSIFCVVIIVFLSLALVKWVSRPLQSLCDSMEAETPEPLGPLVREATEFGDLARMVRSFFEQQGELRAEVEERRKAEEQIGELNSELEYRVLMRTAQLHTANSELEQEVQERTRAEERILQLNEQLRRRLERLSALRDIDLAIASTMDLRLMVSICLKHVTDQLGVHSAAVLRRHPQSNSLHYVAWDGFKGKGPIRVCMPPGEGLSGACAQTQESVHEPDLSRKRGIRKCNPVLGREKFVFYYAKPLIVKDEVKGVLEVFHREAFTPDQEWLDYLEILSGQLAIAIDNAGLLNDLQRANAELSSAYQATIEGWSRALDMRDRETQGHSERVTATTLRMAQLVGIPEESLIHIKHGALLHDIGKMGVPDAILHKPGRLTDEEWVTMRSHTAKALDMLSPVEYLRPALDIPYCHHEKWDGSGYPRGLNGQDIPLAARIFAIADVYDALISDRPYRDGWPREKAVEYICEHAGSHFDPALVKVFLRLMNETDVDLSSLPNAQRLLNELNETGEVVELPAAEELLPQAA